MCVFQQSPEGMNILVVCSCELSILKTGQGRPSSKPEAHNSLKKLHGLWLQCILVHWSYYYQRHVLLLYSSPVVHVTITFFGRITLISENVGEQSLRQTQDTQGSHHVYENALLKVSASPALPALKEGWTAAVLIFVWMLACFCLF